MTGRVKPSGRGLSMDAPGGLPLCTISRIIERMIMTQSLTRRSSLRPQTVICNAPWEAQGPVALLCRWLEVAWGAIDLHLVRRETCPEVFDRPAVRCLAEEEVVGRAVRGDSLVQLPGGVYLTRCYGSEDYAFRVHLPVLQELEHRRQRCGAGEGGQHRVGDLVAWSRGGSHDHRVGSCGEHNRHSRRDRRIRPRAVSYTHLKLP